ncbi:MAG TPA: response regulator [Bacteroidota bacterium]|nr:response regulator [Bacteroidota bacterium]
MEPQEILESISGGFFALDTNFTFTYWNRAAEEGTGYSRDEVLGKHVFEIFPNAEAAELGDRYRTAMETKTFQSFETSYRDDHFEAWYNIRIYPNENGLSVFFQDITQQKQQERQRETQLEISHVINTSNQLDDLCAQVVHIIAARYDLPFHHVLMYVFRAQDEKLLLVAPELPSLEWEKALMARSVSEHSPVASVDAVITGDPIITSDVSRSSYYAVAPEIVIDSGPKTVLGIPLKVEGEIVGVIEMLMNSERAAVEREESFLVLIANELAVGISRRGLIDELRVKNVDLEIQRAQTLDAHETLKKFLAFFSHELRSPLNSIIGFSELIQIDLPKLDTATVSSYIGSINQSGKHLLQLINDILDLSKLEAGRLELHYMSIPIRQFIEALTKSVQPQMEAKRLSFDIQISDELDDIVADDVRLKQILLNLITNAIKFSHVESKITVKVVRVDNSVEFGVTDEGIGIRPDELPRLFMPFQQTSAGKRKQEGTGLGLSITKKLVELHGGTVTAVSEWGKGSTFIVRMPMMINSKGEEGEIAGSIAGILTPSAEPQRVLIVEDKPHARQILQSYLSEAGYVIETAANGVEALEKAKLWKPDVITLDILLPIKDGWQVLRELKQHPLCKNIPVIIVSMLDERNVGFGLGAVDYFVKPVQKDALLESLRKVTSSLRQKQSAKILVIDDDRSVIDLVQVILEAEGCTVIKALDGREGLRLAQEEHPDLIILDLVMPEISGFNVAYQLKHNPMTQTIPVIVMTSMEIDDETREQLRGFVVSLMKKSGFTKKDLLQEISAIETKRQ